MQNETSLTNGAVSSNITSIADTLVAVAVSAGWETATVS